ncbi:MAG: tRNA 2-selenouridine(34) synthase MnmH [Rhodobacteraceae bacterium]|nr:tRNA 2-selenouridine(34) synthase MnmH [Paracoccaceae bacterium]
MVYTLTDLAALRDAPFDDLIDVRSPAEFAEDHLPGAINLPVLSNEERARVGTMYVRESRFGARKIGAALVLRNTAHHIETALADRSGAWQPLVYCWRGGQRSGTFGWLLGEIGWRAQTLQGGYRTFRRAVVARLYDKPLAHRLVVLAGMTCTAKTDLLALLAGQGLQVIDLEGLAHHRGSVFGGRAAPQPSQKMFESRLAMALAACDPAAPVIVEAESSKIGDLLVPPQVWQAMCAAPRVAINAPLPARARYFTRAYADLVADPAAFKARIAALVSVHGYARTGAWQALVDAGEMEAVASQLMELHYDPRYAKSASRHGGNLRQTLNLTDLEPEALAAALPDLVGALMRADGARRALSAAG